jgi:hypothetical protein
MESCLYRGSALFCAAFLASLMPACSTPTWTEPKAASSTSFVTPGKGRDVRYSAKVEVSRDALRSEVHEIWRCPVIRTTRTVMQQDLKDGDEVLDTRSESHVDSVLTGELMDCEQRFAADARVTVNIDGTVLAVGTTDRFGLVEGDLRAIVDPLIWGTPKSSHAELLVNGQVAARFPLDELKRSDALVEHTYESLVVCLEQPIRNRKALLEAINLRDRLRRLAPADPRLAAVESIYAERLLGKELADKLIALQRKYESDELLSVKRTRKAPRALNPATTTASTKRSAGAARPTPPEAASPALAPDNDDVLEAGPLPLFLSAVKDAATWADEHAPDGTCAMVLRVAITGGSPGAHIARHFSRKMAKLAELTDAAFGATDAVAEAACKHLLVPLKESLLKP